MEATPVSRESLQTECGGMRLQSCPNTEFGCGWFGVLFYHLCRVAELKSHANDFFWCFNQNSHGTAVGPNRQPSYGREGRLQTLTRTKSFLPSNEGKSS